MKQRPNILFITSDQHRWDCFGFEHRKVHTPHLDQLALEGARFSRCITPNVVCQPARASLLTGMLPYTHGVIDNGIDLPSNIGELGFAGQLAQTGYQTALLGKAHFSSKATFDPTGRPECQYSSADYSPDWFGPYMGFEHVELMVMGHFQRRTPPGHRALLPFEPPLGQHYERWFHGQGGPGYARKLWEDSVDGHGLLAAQTWNSALPESWHTSTWVADRTIDYLSSVKEDSDPFCVWASFPDPHHPFDCPAPWNKMYNPEEVDLPEHRFRDLDLRPWWHQKLYGEDQSIDPSEYTNAKLGSAARVSAQTDTQLRHMTANYYGMISLLDHNVGRILTALNASGQERNTLVVFTTDHGELLGDHGLILKGPTLYEGLTKVGLIVRGPSIPAGQIISEPVSTLDLAATFYDYSGVESPSAAQSQSLKRLLEQQSETRDMAYNEWRAGSDRYQMTLDLNLVQTKRFKATFELESGDGEMYDLQEDPNEMVNLFHDPGYRNAKKELEDMMHARPGEKLEEPLPRVGIN
jgi:arylsulfatase A-like enzyme